MIKCCILRLFVQKTTPVAHFSHFLKHTCEISREIKQNFQYQLMYCFKSQQQMRVSRELLIYYNYLLQMFIIINYYQH